MAEKRCVFLLLEYKATPSGGGWAVAWGTEEEKVAGELAAMYGKSCNRIFAVEILYEPNCHMLYPGIMECADRDYLTRDEYEKLMEVTENYLRRHHGCEGVTFDRSIADGWQSVSGRASAENSGID